MGRYKDTIKEESLSNTSLSSCSISDVSESSVKKSSALDKHPMKLSKLPFSVKSFASNTVHKESSDNDSFEYGKEPIRKQITMNNRSHT